VLGTASRPDGSDHIVGAVDDTAQGSGLNKFEIRRGQEERKAQAEKTAASQADIGRLEQTITHLKAVIHSLGGKP
jgi:hypothetical protein